MGFNLCKIIDSKDRKYKEIGLADIKKWEKVFINYISSIEFKDASHDFAHFQRVYQVTLEIVKRDNLVVDELVLLAACYFHDIVSFKKDDPKRKEASRYASLKAVEILTEMNFPSDKLKNVAHCILTHSYSANIRPETLEAKIVQDADRMEAIGAIGLARVFYVSGQMQSQLFNSLDPFAKKRELNDKKFALDHFFTKLLKLKNTMNTEGAKSIATEREVVLLNFVESLKKELGYKEDTL